MAKKKAECSEDGRAIPTGSLIFPHSRQIAVMSLHEVTNLGWVATTGDPPISGEIVATESFGSEAARIELLPPLLCVVLAM